MAAGLGFKTFTTGEVLTAADVNGYLMQGILVFATEAARNSAITSPQEGQFAFTKDNNSLWYYTGSAWVASGATGDIEGVTAGVGISGGGTSGTVTITNSMATAIDAKGDLVAGTGADTFSRLAVGANGTVLTADSAEATGLKWAAAAGGGVDWVAWTPTYNNLTIGNGTVTSVKAQDGEMGYFFWRLEWGSTTSITGSDPYINLPYTNLYGNTTFYGGIKDASAGTFYVLLGQTATSGSQLYLATEKSDATYVTVPTLTSSIPITFATGDILVVSGAYPV